mmetsp:Transcript_88491/g.235058  ORF Transcript_88491/g.235058 Transcript_88491/m.235058 type:complete len:214 (+) Transcript_88491:356-997(+)
MGGIPHCQHFMSVPMPPWMTAQEQRVKSQECGALSTNITFFSAYSRSGCISGPFSMSMLSFAQPPITTPRLRAALSAPTASWHMWTGPFSAIMLPQPMTTGGSPLERNSSTLNLTFKPPNISSLASCSLVSSPQKPVNTHLAFSFHSRMPAPCLFQSAIRHPLTSSSSTRALGTAMRMSSTTSLDHSSYPMSLIGLNPKAGASTRASRTSAPP